MKTTVEIAPGLLREAKAAARKRDTTLRALIEQGLRLALDAQQQPRQPFQLKDGSWGHGGMVADFTWPELRALAYGDRGGGEPE